MTARLPTMLCIVAGLAGCSKQSPEGDSAFDKSFSESFVRSCVSSSTKRGVPNDIASSVCNCAIETINRKYSTYEKATLSDEQLQAAMKPCADEAMKTNG